MVGDREMEANDSDITLELLEIWQQHQEEQRPRSNLSYVWDPPSGEDTMVRED
jgi:hypothetical protein